MTAGQSFLMVFWLYVLWAFTIGAILGFIAGRLTERWAKRRGS